MDVLSAPVFGRDGGRDGEMEKMREMGSVMMKGRDDGMESKMGCGQREVRWWCGDGAVWCCNDIWVRFCVEMERVVVMKKGVVIWIEGRWAS
ncbi:hypothetical protein AAC387_Pa11g0825 [Persea americana]